MFKVLNKDGFIKTNGLQGPTGATGSTGAAGAAGANGTNGRVVLFDSTLGSDTATIDTGAGGIAGGYSLLEIYMLARSNEAIVGATLTMLVNNDTGANYDRQFIRGDDTTVSAATGTAGSNWVIAIAGASCAAGIFSVLHLVIPGYTQTVAQKTGILTHTRVDPTAANRRMEVQGMHWRSTAAITRFSMTALATKLLLTGSRLLIVGN